MTEELNRRHNLATMPTINNNGESYIVPFDIYKEGYDAYDISNWFKGRVGDNGTPFGIRWYKHGQLMDVTGMRPFIEGQVGDYTIDDSDPDDPKINMDSEASNVHVVGEVNDCQEYGVAIYRLINQAMPQSGIFYGKIGVMGTQDDGTTVMSSVDVVFKVLAGHMNMLGARKFYVSELEKAWLDLQARIKKYQADYKDATDKQAEQFKEDTEKALADLNTKIANEIKRAEDTLGDTQASIDNNLAALKRISVSVGALQAQLDARDLETNFDHKADIKALKDDIGFRFSQIKHPVQAYDSLDQIKAKYPNGADGDMLAVDTGHIYIYQWDSNVWKDCGVYQTHGLSQSDQANINNALKGSGTLADPTVAPYNDLNTLPSNTILTYPNVNNVKHLPEILQYDKGLEGITVATYSYSTGSKGGTVQVLHTSNNDRFWRIKWGENDGSYGNWNNPIFSKFDVILADTLKPPFADCNTLLDNTLTIYANGLDHVSNSPEDVDHGAILTLNLRQDKFGKFQLLYLENKTYFRMWWGPQTSPQLWQLLTSYQMPPRLISSADNLDIPSKYQDLNTLPLNQVVTYSSNSNLKNYPSNFGPATVITLGADLSGAVQIMIDANTNLAIRICWGMPHIYTGWRRIGGYEPKPSLALFRSIGIIGDSYASGELAFDKNIDHYNMSWGQILGRKIGATVVNYTRGGQTTKGWLDDTERGLGLLNKTAPQDLYILALGINDYSWINLGVPDDMTKTVDSFYSYYPRIVQAIQAKAPHAKIIMATLSFTGVIQSKFNEAIRNIADHFKLPYITLNNDSFFTSDFYLNHMHGGHPTGPVYAEMANAYERLISQAMVDNLDYFENYEEELPTDNSEDLSRINAKIEPAKQDAPRE